MYKLFESVKAWVEKPDFKDPDKNLTAFSIQMIALVCIAVSIISSVTYSIIGAFTYVVLLLTIILLEIFVIILVRFKRLTLARNLFLVFALGLEITGILVGGGIHTVVSVLYPVILLFAGLFLNRKSFILFAALCVASVGLVIYVEHQRLIPAYVPDPPNYPLFISYSLIIAATAIFVRFITENLLDNLNKTRRIEQQIRQHALHAERLASFSKLLTQANRDYQLVLDTVVRYCADVIGDGASILLYTSGQKFLDLAAVYNPDPQAVKVFSRELQAHPVRVDEAGYGRVIETGQSLLIPSILPDDLIKNSPAERREYFENLPFYSIMLAPLRVQGEILGILGLGRHSPGRDYTPDDLAFLEDMADRSAMAILNSRLYQELEQRARERESLIEELGMKNSELERFTYTVSHDLKSPLITINGFLEYVEQDMLLGDQERLRLDSQRIREATNRMHLLLNDLLELSRIGRLANPFETIAFEELVKASMDSVRGQIEAGGVRITIEPNLPAVYGDRQRLVEVLQNLIDNATKFMGAQSDPHIEIGMCKVQGASPVFYVRDNGIGISPDHYDRIFGLFNKLDPNSEGTGIGLALVKRIIEVHGGKVWLESELGQGTTFYFTLRATENI